MQRKPDGGARIVLAYLSIGEAEDYRSYWQRDWSVSPPAWLGAENPDWPGNYAVNYWDEAGRRSSWAPRGPISMPSSPAASTASISTGSMLSTFPPRASPGRSACS